MPLRLPSGTSVGGPLKTKVQSAALRQEVESLVRGSNYRYWFESFLEFDQATLASPWTTRIAGTTPTMAKTANAVDGIWQGALAATSEAETAGVDFGDSLMLNVPYAGATNVGSTGRPMLEAYIRIPTALTTAQTMVIGVATAFNATLTSIAEYAWFRLTANMNVLIETKDGTTTNLAVAPTAGTFTLTANQFYLFSVDLTDPTAVRFSIDDAMIGVLSMANLTAAMKLQPAIYLQKASGTTTPAFDIDWAMVSAVRSAF